ncbi:MAG: Ig-like domain-containing protein [Pseudomonadota bacterium]
MKNYSNVLIPLCLSALFLAGCGGSDKKKPPKPTNTSPTATAASFSTQAETAYTGAVMGSDADMDALTYSVTTQPTNGILTLQNNGSFTYLPNAEVTGADTFSFVVSDGKATSVAATVNITIDLLTVSFDAYSRAAFMQTATANALPLNSRSVTQDVTDETAYDDLLGE